MFTAILPALSTLTQPALYTNGHRAAPRVAAKTVPRLAPQKFGHPEDGHWLKEPDGFERLLFLEPLSVTQVVYLVLKRTMLQTGSFPPREPHYVKLSYAYFMRGGRMSHRSVVRGLQTAVERGYLLRQPVGKQQWQYAIQWEGEQNCTNGHVCQK